MSCARMWTSQCAEASGLNRHLLAIQRDQKRMMIKLEGGEGRVGAASHGGREVGRLARGAAGAAGAARLLGRLARLARLAAAHGGGGGGVGGGGKRGGHHGGSHRPAGPAGRLDLLELGSLVRELLALPLLAQRVLKPGVHKTELAKTVDHDLVASKLGEHSKLREHGEVTVQVIVNAGC